MADVAQLVSTIADDITTALAIQDPQERTDALAAIAAAVFSLAAEDGAAPAESDEFTEQMASAIERTTPESSPDLVAHMLATAAVNAQALAAAGQAEVTWVTMADDKVRETHRPLHGVTVTAGTPFDVGGEKMFYPGQPIGPPEGWANCRCTLSTTAVAASVDWDTVDAAAAASECPEGQHLDEETGECVDDEIVARAFDTAKRKKMADSGTAMPDGSFPIGDVEDLRNAIQAIGRAKDPDAAKRHIRKRARALGHPELIPDSWTAAAVDLSLIAVDTHDAPGWITNPRETQRLRTYWTKGTGAAKIRWGLPGDFNRCRKQLGKYVHNPEWLAGTCANLHFVALGFWPGQGPHASAAPATPIGEAVTAAFLAAADIESLPPREWFDDPGLTAPTALVVDGDRIFGHLATWGTCHVGIEGACTEAPRSMRDYAYFRTGEVETAAGTNITVGQITMDTGHAPREADPRSTVAHYDDTGTVVADVAAGEDEHGIWIAGSLRPGVTDAQRRALRAGALSGDWRRIAGNLELVAALVVNVPGFPIPRTEMAASLDQPLSLVAAGVVVVDPNAERIAELVVAQLDARDRRTATAARIEKMTSLVRKARAEAVLAAVEMG